jgi:hypothetical protein
VAAVERATRRRVDDGKFDDDGQGWIDFHDPSATEP